MQVAAMHHVAADGPSDAIQDGRCKALCTTGQHMGCAGRDSARVMFLDVRSRLITPRAMRWQSACGYGLAPLHS